MKSVQYIIKNTGKKIISNRMAIFCIAFIILSWTYDQPYLQYIQEKNHPITWCIFPFYMAAFPILSVFYMGIVYINADVPFMQHQNMYQVIRCGRSRWVTGQIAGILLRSFTAVLVSAIASLLPFVGHIEFGTRWGKVAKTLASQGMENNFGFDQKVFLDFRFFYEIMNKQTPVGLMIHTILVCTLICTFLGLLMFCLSLYFSKMIAVAGALGAVVALFIVQNTYGEWKLRIAHFVPTYWAEIALSATRVSGRYRMPSLPYIYCALALCIVLLIFLISWKIRRVEFVWENEDM